MASGGLPKTTRLGLYAESADAAEVLSYMTAHS